MWKDQWCSPRDQSLGLEAARGQKIKSWSWSWSWGKSLGLDKKVLRIFKTLWVWLIAGTKNNNLGRDWVLVLFSIVLSELVYIRPTAFIIHSYACRVYYTVLFILWPWYGNLFSGPGSLGLDKKSLIYITGKYYQFCDQKISNTAVVSCVTIWHNTVIVFA